MRYFNYIYYHLYLSSKINNAAPEIPVIVFISFCQTNNILTIFNLFLLIFNINYNYKIHVFYIVIQVILYIANYYYYQTRKTGKSIITNEGYSIGRKSFLIYVYIVLSVFLTGFTYYILK